MFSEPDIQIHPIKRLSYCIFMELEIWKAVDCTSMQKYTSGIGYQCKVYLFI
uniref:Uncharacterized protein n=1 Tax=Rhizophora mucronata TaxID=61149 RepID=A0A2P2PXX3_RHIMU